MTPRLPPCHSEPVTDVTGVGIRVPSFQIYPVFFNLLYRKIPILFHAFIR